MTLSAQETRSDSIIAVKNALKTAKESMLKMEIPEIISNLELSNSYAPSLDDNTLKANVLLELARLNYLTENYPKAIIDIDKSIMFLENTPNKELLARSHALKGFITIKQNKFSEATNSFKVVDDILNLNPNELINAKNLSGKGLLAMQTNEYEVAVNYFDASIPIFNSNEDYYNEAFSHIHKAESLLHFPEEIAENAIIEAKKAIDKAKPIIENNDFIKLSQNYYKVSAMLGFRTGDIEKAESNFTNYQATTSKLNELYILATSEGVDSEFNIVDLNNKIKEQEQDIADQQKSISFTKMTTALSVALIVILSLLTLSLYKNNNLRAKANDLLQDKNTELELAKEKAEKASLAKAQFLSTITHELRTPMYAVTGLTDLLMDENPTPNQKEHLNSLKFSGEYLLSLINNILDLNKLDANKVEVEKTTFSLEKRLKDVLIALKKSADDRNNVIKLEFDESIPKKLIGDPLKISQIFINLVGNSVKFTENGKVTIRVKNKEKKNNKILLLFEVEDNGVGISRKKQKSIFETFSQASLQVNRKFGGTGLGLSIVKNLLQLLDSKIHLESQLGKGSKFWFTINFGVVELSEKEVHKKEEYVVDFSKLKNKKILVVEDNKINQMITKKILEKNNIICEVADNGLDAVKMVGDTKYDLILMDIHMPGISGVEATKKIRLFNESIPIIALTAVTIDENLDTFFEAGFNEIIPKPFKTNDFFEKIYKTLESVQKEFSDL
ncbi:response regulator [Patiriisocius hiemis]|uniref:histidine kinase n=1 Tax=Patiriisocius hiemis TaxID=3075604 RepID=A0ABU2YCQ7_9FLAO|nr:response regulator [Constantimarinum sp. W242]MDT0555951.1 response regulator [Constantimarinum sp. W242]